MPSEKLGRSSTKKEMDLSAKRLSAQSILQASFPVWKVYVRPGLEAGDIFRGISQELAHAHLDDGAYKRSDHAFTAYCVSYVLCSRYNVPKDMFRFDRLPEGFSTMDARSVRNELSKIRDVANEISSDMVKVLDKSMKPKERRDEAR